jgi:hypothetical protein
LTKHFEYFATCHGNCRSGSTRILTSVVNFACQFSIAIRRHSRRRDL